MLAPLLGCAAGIAHVLTGPDHLAAVSALAAGSPRRSWILGLRWGLGHSLGIVLLGALALVLQRSCGIESASGWADRAVGAGMVILGLWALRRALRQQLHEHPHDHGDHSQPHAHYHLHLPGPGHRHPHSHGDELVQVQLRPSTPQHQHSHAPYAVGILHGFGGGAQLFGVLPALAFAQLGQASAYFAGFVIGSLAIMAVFAALIGRVASRGRGGVHRGFAATCALASCGVGAWWMIG